MWNYYLTFQTMTDIHVWTMHDETVVCMCSKSPLPSSEFLKWSMEEVHAWYHAASIRGMQ
jgi:hypothetical protein